MKTALIAGATGLVGNYLLHLLLQSDQYAKVVAISRKPLDHSHSKLKNLIATIDDLPSLSNDLTGDDVFCCVGTTMKKAKTEAAFRKVDYEFPIELARITHRNGALQYLVISALGAKVDSAIYYNRIKGEVERDLRKVGFETLHIFRPSLLLGPRDDDRAGESGAKLFFKWFGFLVPKKYKAIDGEKVARAMLAHATAEQKGAYFHESQEMQSFNA